MSWGKKDTDREKRVKTIGRKRREDIMEVRENVRENWEGMKVM